MTRPDFNIRFSTPIKVKLAAPDSEFSGPFVQGMADRMAVSFHKYGPVEVAYPDRVSALNSLQQRIDAYLETGNTEFLMDVANFAMIEFMHPSLEGAFFRATDSDEAPGRVDHKGRTTSKPNALVAKRGGA